MKLCRPMAYYYIYIRIYTCQGCMGNFCAYEVHKPTSLNDILSCRTWRVKIACDLEDWAFMFVLPTVRQRAPSLSAVRVCEKQQWQIKVTYYILHIRTYVHVYIRTYVHIYNVSIFRSRMNTYMAAYTILKCSFTIYVCT